MIIRVDIDGVLCTNTDGEYQHAKPLRGNIAKINRLHDQGHEIILWTARGTTTGVNWKQLTLVQLATWDVKYHKLEMNKPYYDLLIDDKARAEP